MAKNSRQKKAPLSFSVKETEKVLKLCQNELKPLLDKRELNFIPLQQDSERHIFALITKDSSGLMAIDDRKNRHNIVPLLTTGSDTYWINISLTFLPKTNPQNFQFAGVSIRVFKGLAYDNNKEPLIRAEWDALKYDNDNNNHAQPHWHVYKSFQEVRNLNTSPSLDFKSLIQSNKIQDFGEKENNSLDNQEEFDIENDKESLDEYNWDSSTKFHFAMSSQWHTGGTHRVILDQERLLYSWLVECVKYIKEQLKYVDR